MKNIEKVGAIDPTKHTSAVNMEGIPPTRTDVCYWNGQAYPPGATICANGLQMRCETLSTPPGAPVIAHWRHEGRCET
jgi:hypothetical protein